MLVQNYKDSATTIVDIVKHADTSTGVAVVKDETPEANKDEPTTML